MTNSDNAQDRIKDYLRREIFKEDRYVHSYAMDPYTRFFYRKALELYWTLSRFGRAARKALFGEGTLARRPLLEAVAQPVTGNPRIFIDVTDLLASGKSTGIQRVVREIANNAAKDALAIPVVMAGGALAPAPGVGVTGEIVAQPGDLLLLLDSGWNRLDDYFEPLAAFRAQGGKWIAGLHDLFPLTYPALYRHVLRADFEVWVERIVMQSDAVVANSRCTAESYVEFLGGDARKRMANQPVGWWRLGSDFNAPDGEAASVMAKSLIARGPFFLAVGTVEMRKGFPLALDAFERLWADGCSANLVIAGAPGWNAAAFEERLNTHRERGRRLHWIIGPSDADLHCLYRAAQAVILPSFAEGFGLPLVEAAQFGAPIIASDIPVFREIAGDGVSYFDVLDARSLAARIGEALATEKRAPEIGAISWRESTHELIGLLRSSRYQMSPSSAGE